MEDIKQLKKVAENLANSNLASQVYEDGLQPAVQEIGKGLKTIASAINMALAPVSGLVWGYIKIADYIKQNLEEKFEGKDIDSIISPPPNIAVPLLESLRYTAYQEDLRKMYINLLSTSMDKDKAEKAHPAFVEIIKQLSPDEAKLLSYFPKLMRYPGVCYVRVDSSWAWGQQVYSEVEKQFILICKDANIEHIDLVKNYLDNMRRLMILEFRQEVPGKIIERRFEKKEIETNYVEYISVTKLGQQFISACVVEDNNLDDK